MIPVSWTVWSSVLPPFVVIHGRAIAKARVHAPLAVVALDPFKDPGPRAPAAPMDELGLEGGEKLTTQKVQIS